MKIIRDTPDQLILASVPWLMSILLTAIILIFVTVGLSLVFDGDLMGLFFAIFGGGIGAACFVAFVRRVQVIFDRRQQTFTIRRRTVFGYKENTRALGDVDHALIEHTTNSDGQRLDRPTLVMRRGGGDLRMPIVTTYSNSNRSSDIVEAINRWMGDGDLDSAPHAP